MMNISKTSLVLLLCTVSIASAQRGMIRIPVNAEISVPDGAQVCADTIYANFSGYGTLRLANGNGICSGTIIIPVELLAFSVSVEKGDVILRWSTASETNSYGFEVQRMIAAAGGGWNQIGFIQAAGTTTENRYYSFTDLLENSSMKSGTLAYRLRMVDLDGSFGYSPTVEVNLNGAPSTFTFHPIYPNPASDKATVSFSLPEASAVTLTVNTTNGAEVLKLIDASFNCGLHTTSIRTAGLSRGAYLIELRAGKMRKSQTVLLGN